ncbi:MAG: LCP family protein [Erysipelotrichaceae bacterium]|nr:LCP family protein [Erysipelotrichaceae bacterium]MBR5049013.1 LCP family protein [Erysipelotrichaceae bacterium]
MAEKKVISSTEREQLRKKLNRRRKFVKAISKISWLALFAASIGIYFVVKSFGVIPDKYLKIMIIALGGFSLFMAIFAWIPAVNNLNKMIQTVTCTLLAAAMIAGIVILPTYKGMMEKMFTPVPTEGTLNINAYVLRDGNFKEIEDLAGKKVGIQRDLDVEYQNFAIKVINKEIKGNDIWTSEYDDIYLAVDALLNGEVDAILLNEDYANIIADNSDYEDFTSKVKSIYTCSQQIHLDVDPAVVENMTKEPFVVGIIGQDTWTLDGIDKASGFRSDVNILVVVNPKTRQILMITTPRDAYVPLYGKSNMMDKLTHSPFYKGIQGWMDTLNAYYGVKINYYVRVNFTSLKDIVDAVGGIDIVNPEAFSSDYYFDYMKDDDAGGHAAYKEIEFPEGPIHLDGQMALTYCRERHRVKGGDLGRNQHQAIVMKALIDKACSVSVITKVDDLLKAVQGKFSTNLTYDEISAFASYQLEGMYDWKLQSYSASGSTGPAMSALVHRDLSMVFISASSLNKAKTYIMKTINGEEFTVEQ